MSFSCEVYTLALVVGSGITNARKMPIKCNATSFGDAAARYSTSMQVYTSNFNYCFLPAWSIHLE